MTAYRPFRLKGMLFYLATVVTVSGQVATQAPPVLQGSPAPVATQPSTNQATLQAFQAGQQALAQNFMVLELQNPTPQQVQVWRLQNATALAAQQQQATLMGAASALQPMPTATEVEIPENASQTMSDFLVARGNLANARAQIHNQLIQAIPASSAQSMASTSAGQAQISQIQQTEEQQYEQQNAPIIQAQQQRAQTLAAEADQQPLPIPPPLSIPAGSTPQMQSFLTLRDQLMRGEIAVHNQNLQADAATREAALQTWRQSNTGLYQQLNALAQNLATPAN